MIPRTVFGSDHDIFRESVARFMDQEIAPNHDRWEKDGVVPREADVGSILGWGFAPFTGGVLSYIDMVGTKDFVAECEKLAQECGPRFAPPALLRDMAAKGKGFYQ